MPGLDGLSYEFYKPVLLFNSMLESNLLGESQRLSVTRLIPKPWTPPTSSGKFPCFARISNIHSKIIATRLLSVLPAILSSSQLCGCDEKNILFGATEIISTIKHINVKKILSYLVSFDILIGYDKPNIEYVIKGMQHMNFRDTFIR